MTDGEQRRSGQRRRRPDGGWQLALAVHDAQVAYDCIALGAIDRAHTNAITARAAVDAAEAALRAALGGAIAAPGADIAGPGGDLAGR